MYHKMKLGKWANVVPKKNYQNAAQNDFKISPSLCDLINSIRGLHWCIVIWSKSVFFSRTYSSFRTSVCYWRRTTSHVRRIAAMIDPIIWNRGQVISFPFSDLDFPIKTLCPHNMACQASKPSKTAAHRKNNHKAPLSRYTIRWTTINVTWIS